MLVHRGRLPVPDGLERGTDQSAEAGILDYDRAYFDDSDLSWEAEDTGHELVRG
jgi:hypothetical protein